jgi:hypothetical protein
VEIEVCQQTRQGNNGSRSAAIDTQKQTKCLLTRVFMTLKPQDGFISDRWRCKKNLIGTVHYLYTRGKCSSFYLQHVHMAITKNCQICNEKKFVIKAVK